MDPGGTEQSHCSEQLSAAEAISPHISIVTLPTLYAAIVFVAFRINLEIASLKQNVAIDYHIPITTYLSHEIAVSVNTEAEIDKMAMKFEILQ